MELNLIKNTKHYNHLKMLKKMSTKSDTLIILSPFLTSDFSALLKEMNSIKNITLYTTLQKYNDTPQKVIALYELCKYCQENSIDLIIKIDDNLHGKVYLFYNGIMPTGFVLTSGNFTQNGLVNNHEYGISLVDAEKQMELANMVMSTNTYDLTYKQLCEIYVEAEKFIENHPAEKQEKFNVHKLINKKPSATQSGTLKYYLKPVGTSQTPFIAPMRIKEVDDLGFGKNPKNLNKGDVLLLHSVGPSSIVGYYVIVSDEAFYEKQYEDDRWPWKVKAECHSIKFSSSWWDYDLKTQALIDEFLELHPTKHITVAGGNTLGGLQYGSDKLNITPEFAQFVISKIPD